MIWCEKLKRKPKSFLVQAKFLMPPANIIFLCYPFSCLNWSQVSGYQPITSEAYPEPEQSHTGDVLHSFKDFCSSVLYNSTNYVG
jgi:hypothetical protein